MPETWEQTNFDPSLTSSVYDTLKDEWELNTQMVEKHLDELRDGTCLDRFGGDKGEENEADAQYTWRKKASFAVDPCAELIDLRVNNIFRTPPARDFEGSPFRSDIEAFLKNVDDAGTSMDAFMRRCLPLYYTNGVDFVVVKQSANGAEPATLHQERELGMLPYVQAFGPAERLDWSVTGAGRFLWARYSLGTPPSEDETVAAEDVKEYLTVTPSEWRLYRTTAEDKKSGTEVLSRTHSLDQCPIVPFYFAESTRPGYRRVPLSLLTQIAPIARHMVNLVSEIQVDIFRNVFFLVATGVKSEDIPKTVRPGMCWALPEGAAIENISGDVAHIIQKISFLDALTLAILRIGKVTGNTGDMKTRAASGVQVAVERTELDNELKATAQQLAEVETEIVRMAISRLKGKNISRDELKYVVRYNDRYVLSDMAALIANAKEFFGIAGLAQNVPTLARAVVEKIVDAAVRQEDVAHADIIKELDEAVQTMFDTMGPGPGMSEDDGGQNGGTPMGVDAVEESDEERQLAEGVK